MGYPIVRTGRMLRLSGLSSCLLVLSGCATVAPPSPPVRGDISVSAANYKTTPHKQLVKIANRPVDVEGSLQSPAPPQPAETRRYIFYPGDIYASDLRWDDLRPHLETALAAKGYVNAEDAQGIVRDLKHVSLVLRISYGERIWRDPVVRISDLQWNEGILAGRRMDSAFSASKEVLWDRNAGGDDGGLFAAMSALGTGENGVDPSTAAIASDLIDGKRSRPHFLIVVDAFDILEVLRQGSKAKRLWTTFIAMPKEKGTSFSAVASAMLKRAAPYFGETTTGKVMFPYGRVEVEAAEPDAGQSTPP